ncbi:MAG: pyruvate, phosphate dikinase [Planctomycetia bacterium]|nr:pyruvate, phosphate dikinase [Planctomycetia bacterium]
MPTPRHRRVALKTIYEFGPGRAEGDGTWKELLGGKGAGLAEMCRLGLPVPPGFTIPTTVCPRYYASGGKVPADVMAGARKAIARLEKELGRGFGRPERPLLVSVRSGAAVSMPGMMDTVLNLGLSAACVEGLAKLSGNRRFALDARRRFIQMFGDVVAGVDHDAFEDVLAAAKREAGTDLDTGLDEAALERVIAKYLEAYRAHTGQPFPEDPWEQLERSIAAVFGSWESDRAVKYRKIHGITNLGGTAVNVQAMVFGNLGARSGTGVAFTRDPSTGENVFYGEFLMNAQGEDVVAGIRTPEPIADLAKHLPKALTELMRIRTLLERHYRDIQDIEFTIEEEKLYMLQTRRGKRTAAAAVKVAHDLANEGRITREEAVSRVEPTQLDQLLHPSFDPAARRRVIATGRPASPGAVTGKVVFTAEEAEKRAAAGDAVILVRNETSPEDIGGMHAAQGILTATGGMTSHAAVVARGMGKCCVAGAGTVRIDYDAERFTAGDVVVKAGDVISLDGTAGEVLLGAVPTKPAVVTKEFDTLLGWADGIRRLGVRTNADTPRDAEVAYRYGAEGIGLCRTEHMFFDGDRITAVREMILAEAKEARDAALAKLLPMQRQDFVGIFKEMKGKPVTIRLLDPPLHEFLPHEPEQVRTVAESLGLPEGVVRDRARRLHEMNPMLGHRGCRLGITFPEIYEMQVRAIYEAAAAEAKAKRPVRPEVMIPLVGTRKELAILRERLTKVAQEVLAKAKANVPLVFGTMIEVPRAALQAEHVAHEAEFFSFGTNDLTQMTFGYSRDDAGSFLPAYVEQGILPEDPFQSLDQDGVGELIRMAVERGRRTRPGLKVGICGEHGGDPKSIAFCHRAGLDYVSCSPYRVPVARLAAAHAAIAERAAAKAGSTKPAKAKAKARGAKAPAKPKAAKAKAAAKPVAKARR